MSEDATWLPHVMPLRSAALACRGFRGAAFGPILILTDGAGGFLPGVPLGCLRM